MFYRYPVTVTKDTDEDSQTKSIMDLPAGQIHLVQVAFPWGCAGLVHVRVFRNEAQMWPSNPGESFAWNDYTISFPENEDSLGAPDEWSIRTWNEDLRHDHTIIVRIGVLEARKTLLGSIAQSLFGGPRT